LLCFIFAESVSTAATDGAAKSLGVMKSMMAAVPAILNNMRATDFLPAPCLNGNGAAVDEDLDDEDGSDERAVSTKAEQRAARHNGKSGKDEENEEVVDEEEEEDEEEEDEEEEEEEEEEENHNALEPILAEKMKVPIDLSAQFDKMYRINPLVKVITSTDIRCFERGSSASIPKDAQSSSEAFVVHSGFGNETFESVLRQVVIVPNSMASAAKVLMGIIAEHQVQRQQFFISLEENRSNRSTKRKRGEPVECSFSWGGSSFVTVNHIKGTESGRSLDVSILFQLMQAFVAAGVLTLD
jgi:hypothetical protein